MLSMINKGLGMLNAWFGNDGFTAEEIEAWADRNKLSKYLPFPNHIKIDVDGNEPLIVKGMKDTLKDKRLKSVLIELSDNISEKDTKEIIDLFVKNGFGVYDISEDSDNTSPDRPHS